MPSDLIPSIPPPATDIATCCTDGLARSVTTNPAVFYIESLGSEVSKLTMISPLNKAALILDDSLSGPEAWRKIPWEKISAKAVRFIMAQLKGKPSTRNKALAALKGVARAAWEMAALPTEELARIRSIKGDAGSREPAGRYVTTGELTSILKTLASAPAPAAVRDSALISLAAFTGARRAELASIRLENMNFTETESVAIRIIGKRNKERTIYASGNALHVMHDWLSMRGEKPGAFFCMIRKGGTILPHHEISPTALDKILRKRAMEAGVEDCDWHDLRRTTASNLLDAGADIATVANLLGHSNIQTTAKYDRRGERAKLHACGLVSVPYFKR
ncbi:MAG: site-specific integrase [Prosthecobacter sp.]|nr:site-specific integrase [Prosthecobacter sp.]